MLNRNPEGYKKLLVYQKADELHGLTLRFVDEIKEIEKRKRVQTGQLNKTLLDLADQMGRASRSPLSNIAEGWKRNSTSEYFEFLGFSIASADEVKRDAEDIIRGKYKELMGERGIMGEKELKLEEVKKLPFYPLPPFLPFVVEIYIRGKELDFLLHKLQQSLESKMRQEGTKPLREKLKDRMQQEKEADQWLKDLIEKTKKERTEKGEN